MVKEAVDCYLDGIVEAPKVIRLHFVLDVPHAADRSQSD